MFGLVCSEAGPVLGSTHICLCWCLVRVRAVGREADPRPSGAVSGCRAGHALNQPPALPEGLVSPISGMQVALNTSLGFSGPV